MDDMNIAVRISEEKMSISALERKPFQHCHLWAPSTQTSKLSYNPDKDGPQVAKCPRLPSDLELKSSDSKDKTEYIEIGLVFGKDSKRYMPEGHAKSKKRDKEKDERSVLPRDDNVMRVFVAVTNLITTQSNRYVGCHFENGRLHTRKLSNRKFVFTTLSFGTILVALVASPRIARAK